ncbi:hypothetical protein ACFV1N_37985 [Streptosporangium canum]|uniref:hypothetical protein n=1 Tax=Streptosporangium canum TaxID=324952 RepID=UPI0036B6B404
MPQARHGRIVLEAAPNPGTEAPLPESTTEAVERLLADLGIVIENLNEDAKLIPELVTQIRDHAAEASIGRPLPEATATRLIMNLVTTITNLRNGPDLIMSLSTDVA